ncbi:HAMP domain-containing sensor histidine kinase, partial [Desulfuromonas sp.]
RDEICEGCLVEKSFADGRIHRRETRAETERGPLFLEVASCPLKDADGKVTACVEVARDVTEKRLAEEKLAQLKEEVLSGISHEMSTPLTAMIGFAEFMLDNELEREEQREYLAILLKESFRLGDLIDNILALQRFRAGFSLEQLASVSLAPLLEEVAELFRRSASRHQIVLECPADLPPVQGDESRLQQVVKNLLSNAVKYSPEGGTVTLGARGEGETVILSVTDRGLGIPADEQENVFERFFRGRVRAKISGTGLGLALVKEVVEAHGGAVRVESAEGQGSTFSLRLPLDGPAGSSRGKLPA